MQNMQTVDQTVQTVQTVQTGYFFSYSRFYIYFWLAYVFGSGHKLVFNYISECLLRTGRSSSVFDCWRDVDFARETPFGPKYAYVKLF